MNGKTKQPLKKVGIRSTRSWSQLIPLLLFFSILILIFGNYTYEDVTSIGDQNRYMTYAENLLQGYYTDADNPFLDNGPGYPIFLAPFVALHLSPIIPSLLNGLLVFFSVVFFFKTLRFYLPRRAALFASYGFGLYYPIYRHMVLLQTESLALFLICAVMYFTIKALRSPNPFPRELVWSGLACGGLALTKIFFGNVILVCLIASLFAYFFISRQKALKCMAILLIGMICTLPWLFYTYSVTGRFPYWGTQGGEQLYWMSVRYDGEYGNWNYFFDMESGMYPDFDPAHVQLYQSIKDKTFIEQNDTLLQIAKSNILHHPQAYLANLPANFSRLWFNLPESHQKVGYKHLYYILANMFLLVPLAFSLIPAWTFRKDIPFEILGIVFFILVYCGGIILIQARPRHLIVVIPIIILWLAFIFHTYVDIKLRRKKNGYSAGPRQKRIHEAAVGYS